MEFKEFVDLHDKFADAAGSQLEADRPPTCLLELLNYVDGNAFNSFLFPIAIDDYIASHSNETDLAQESSNGNGEIPVQVNQCPVKTCGRLCLTTLDFFGVAEDLGQEVVDELGEEERYFFLYENSHIGWIASSEDTCVQNYALTQKPWYRRNKSE